MQILVIINRSSKISVSTKMGFACKISKHFYTQSQITYVGRSECVRDIMGQTHYKYNKNN